MSVDDIIKSLTIDEKIKLLEGDGRWNTWKIPEKVVPSIMMTDGPHGIRKEIIDPENPTKVTSYPAVLFPTESLVGCSFDPQNAYLMGKAIGEEARNMDVQIVLGPGVNIKRHPACGRNFEYYSEDPVVSGTLASGFIKGVESNNVGACVKHFACNSQEEYRFSIDAIVEQRSLREIYLKAFKMAVDAGVSNVMCCYNQVNGYYGSENKELLQNILRDEWGFKGILMTDWGACNDRALGLINGQDLEMPGTKGHNVQFIKKGYLAGEISEALIDRSVKRILDFVYQHQNTILPCDYAAHHKLAQQIASESMVLLKNEQHLLPLQPTDQVLFVGSFFENMRKQGGGSSFMVPYQVEQPSDIIGNYTTNFQYVPGYAMNEVAVNTNLENAAIEAAKVAHKVVVMVGQYEFQESEGFDRKTIELPDAQNHLVQALLRVNPNVIVVLTNGSVVNMPWVHDVAGLLYANLGGESAAPALLDILFGKVVPSGRLSETFANQFADYITDQNFNQTNKAVWYMESIYVGYRYFNTFNHPVVFPFGYGLSYTDFKYDNFRVAKQPITKSDPIKVQVDVTNTGNYPAKEVVLLFVENNQSSVYKAKRELKKFAKIELAIGETKTVEFTLTYADFAYYDIYLKEENVDKGTYKIQIGKSVEDIIFSQDVECLVNQPNFQEHPQMCYHHSPLQLVENDFATLYGKALPRKSEVKKPPFNLNTPLADLKSSFFGKVIVYFLNRQAHKLATDEHHLEFLLNNFRTITIRSLATFGEDLMDFDKAQGLILVANGHPLKGLKILKKKKGE